MKKLITKTLIYYAVIALTLLLCISPFFYWLTLQLYTDDVDEALYLRRDEFFHYQQASLTLEDIADWNRFNRDTQLLPDSLGQSHSGIVDEFFYDTLSVEWEPYRSLYVPIRIEKKPFTLMIRQNLVESEDIIGNTALLFLLTFLVLLSGFMLVSTLVSRHLWRPFDKTLEQLKHFNLNAPPPTFDKPQVREFAQLNEVLQQLVDVNVEIFRLQKEFTENASHELKTPIAVFQSKLDLLIQSPDLTVEQSQIVEQLYQAISRVSKINKNLILLARMDNMNSLNPVEVSLAEMLKEILPLFSEQLYEKKIQLEDGIEYQLTVSANRTLLEVMVSNLIQNAIRHNIEGGTLSIRLSAGKLVISNSSQGAELEKEVIFRRFSKAGNHPHSTGLGLAIVKKIADLHGWQIHYKYSSGLHSFSIQF
ncbi:HAMP domain-containing sensor histidine kinase [Limibacter armeniacum]|uniref:sensor histidine kinase n=1 Tax=Limibacter armeniacum TaxID=466084 RepID=UPI002FE4FC37